ncbi:glycosyltransferase family 2 protein, partial [Campylobacter jejuni]|nr:glycosyltransferase family 2 protein [Campylobacter jejuni]
LSNYRSLRGLIKIVLNAKKMILNIQKEQELFQETIKNYPFITFSSSENLESRKIKKHYSYRLGKFLKNYFNIS